MLEWFCKTPKGRESSMKQTDWKIIYTAYEGVAKRAVHLLSKEVGAFLIREPSVYRICVLPCEKEGCAISKNAFFVGCYEESNVIKDFVRPHEVPQDGFLVKVIKNPSDAEGRFVILTAHDVQELFYAAVSFFDDYIPRYAPTHGSNRMPDLIFDGPLAECAYTETPDHKTRSIFTWGHSINDYRAYIDNMARLKFNELILWNDYVPLNIKDVIAYAHSYGIKVNLGYSWGWQVHCSQVDDISDASLLALKDAILAKYEKEYADTGCDGIYFQSFTERRDEYIGKRLIAEGVVSLVNMTANELLAKHPALKLQFGLHATSVAGHLDEIAKVDPRVELLWEDCGEFPYHYRTFVQDEKSYQDTLAFTKKMLTLRGGVGVGLVFKGVMMLDWSKFVNQQGPYILGENSPKIAAHDRAVRANAWREYAADWMHNGARVAQTLRFIQENKLGEVNMCIAGTFDGGIYLPFALCAQMYRNCSEDYAEILRKVTRRACITVD